jgi:transposase
MLLRMERTFEYRMRPNTTQEAALFTVLLEYKAAEAGRHVEAVPPHYTSQRCSRCGEYVQKFLSVRTHLCPHCGFVADRDVNAAINILQARTGPSRSTA